MGLSKKAKSQVWFAGVVLALALYDLALGWWASIPPKRPGNGPGDAVFVFAAPVGWIWPLPKRGDWLNCWLDQEHYVNRCEAWYADGHSMYEGPFLRSEGSGGWRSLWFEFSGGRSLAVSRVGGFAFVSRMRL